MERHIKIKQWKGLALIAVFCVTTLSSYGQLGVGITNPDQSSQLDVSSTSKGVLLSRMTKIQRDAISNPAAGLIVYCVDCQASAGFYVFDTVPNPDAWQRVGHTLSTDANFSANSDDLIPSQKAVKSYIDNHKFTNALTFNFDPDAIGTIHTQYLGTFKTQSGPVEIRIGDGGNSHFGASYFRVSRGYNAVPTVDIENQSTARYHILYRTIDFDSYELFFTDSVPTSGAVNYYVFVDAPHFGSHNLSAQNDNGIAPASIGVSSRAKNIGIGIAASLQNNENLKLPNGVGINEFSSDTSLAGNSNSAIPTEAAVRTYVRNYVGNRMGLISFKNDNVHGGTQNFGSIDTSSSSSDFSATNNLALGTRAMEDLTWGDNNIALGFFSLGNINTGDGNVAIGPFAGQSLTNGNSNVSIGYYSSSGGNGSSNVMLGSEAGQNCSGSNNVFVGRRNGKNSTGSNNVFLGYGAGQGETGSQKLYIDSETNSAPLIGGDFSTNNVGINRNISDLTSGADFQVNGDASKSTAGSWLANSDRRLKTDIAYMNSEQMLQKMLLMKGVTYVWNDSVTHTIRPNGIQYGFIAQDIEKLWPTKIRKDGQGYLMTSYGDYDPMFVESIKALYQRIVELEKENEQLQQGADQAMAERNELRDEIAEIKNILQELTSQDIEAHK